MHAVSSIQLTRVSGLVLVDAAPGAGRRRCPRRRRCRTADDRHAQRHPPRGWDDRHGAARSGIDCGSDCTETHNYANGTRSFRLRATPKPGWKFDAWTQCSECGRRLLRHAQQVEHERHRRCKLLAHELLAAASRATGTGNGSVSGPGIACPADCFEEYSAGTRITSGPQRPRDRSSAGGAASAPAPRRPATSR